MNGLLIPSEEHYVCGKFILLKIEHCVKNNTTCYCLHCNDTFCSECFHQQHERSEKK